MDISIIKSSIKLNKYEYSMHADIERKADDLTLNQVEQALLNGSILEAYSEQDGEKAV